MARGKHHNNDRGASRGGFRGRPGGRGRGRGRGRGSPIDNFGDFSIYDWTNNAPPKEESFSGYNSPRGRARGRGSGASTPRGGARPSSGFNSPRGRGRGSPYITIPLQHEPAYDRGRGGRGFAYGRGRGVKNLGSKLRAGAPLSKVLYEDRPLLKPIIFVRSAHTATLFQEKEELLQPLAEDVANDEKSHVPTADRVTRVFNGDAEAEAEDAEDEDEDNSETAAEARLEEIDFSEIGRLQAQVNAAAVNQASMATKKEVVHVEEKSTGFYVDTAPAPAPGALRPTQTVETALGDIEEEVIVYVAPHPRAGPATPPASQLAPVVEPYTSIFVGMQHSEADAGGSLPETMQDRAVSTLETAEEAMMADKTDAETVAEKEPAPHASGFELPISSERREEGAPGSNEVLQNTVGQAASTFEEVSFSFSSKQTRKKITRKAHPVRTPKALLHRTQTRRKSLRRFGIFGASLEEAHLHDRDPRVKERRVGDSDLEWGDRSEIGDGVDEISNGIGAMDMDADIDVNAMISFAKSMSAEGSRHVTMDDVADQEMLRAEDEDEDERSSEDTEDSEVEAIVQKEEDAFIAEPLSMNDAADSEENMSTDDEETPRRGFQARLRKIRENASGKKKAEVRDTSSDEEEDDDEDAEMDLDQSWAEKDEDNIAQMKAILDANEDLSTHGDHKARNHLFSSIQDGDFDLDEYEAMMEPSKRKKKFEDTGLPASVREQWEKDRAIKAENKSKRRLARLEAAADPLTKKKGGKKGLKDMVAAARLAENGPIVLPNRIVDIATLESQIRRFLNNLGGPTSMTLPPCDKATRKKIHELADAFNLKSMSKGNGDKRYTTLTKTSYSGVKIKEGKVRRILKEHGGDWAASGGKGRTHPTSLAKHREGEEVGKAAPKIGESNVGFKLLAAMGWAEGETIGLSGGLDVPLVAKMKKTKLGLGATAY